MNQDGVILAVKYDLKGLLDAFRRDLDVWILVSGERDLKMLDAILFQEFDIIVWIVVANESTTLESISSACNLATQPYRIVLRPSDRRCSKFPRRGKLLR